MVALPYTARFSPDEYARIRRGFVPDQMEDKWFAFFEDHSLYLYRSWTGFCIYVVDIRSCDDHVEVAAARVSAQSERYGRRDDAYECAFLNWLIRGLLLRQPVEFPSEPPIPDSGRISHRLIAASG